MDCLGCGASVSPTNGIVCDTCVADPFAMEDARGRAAERGFVTELAKLYSSTYSYLPEGRISRLWEDNILEGKDTIPEFSRWRNAQSVTLVPRTSRRVLEIGVGSGDAMRALQRRLPGADLYGIDVSEKIVERTARDVRGSFARATIEDLPWRGVEFDAILMLEVLEHVEAPRTFSVLKTLRQRLSPDGVLVVSVPLWEDLRRSFFVCSHCGERIHQIGHLRSYSPALLRSELSLAGYVVDKEVPLAGGRYIGIPRQCG